MLPTQALVAYTIALSFLSSTHAVPTIVYSLMAQEPPVARVNQSFSFSLFPDSFESSTAISYEASGLPSWLSFNAPSLAFTGTPSLADMGQEVVTLTATDASGSISSNFTLITTNYTVPGIHQSFTTQIGEPSTRVISSATTLPGDTGVSVPPFWSFSLGFAADTFRLSRTEPTNGELFVMAHERGTVGLPQWLNFDNDTMTFNGTAPADGSYTIVVTGTDFWGYTGAQTSFVIEVGVGYPIEMVKGGNFSDLIVLARQEVDYTVDLDDILYNGTQATTNEVSLSLNNTDFPWLSLDGTKLTGKVPDEYINGTTASLFIPLTVSSRNTSSTLSLVTWIPFDVTTYFFDAFTLPTVNTSASESVAIDVSSHIVNTNATINATVSPTEAASWLVYHQSNATLVGTVPKSPNYDSVNVTFSATENQQTATTNMLIDISGATGNNGTEGSAAVPNANDNSGLSTGAKVGIAIGAVIAALLILGLIFWFCCYKRRKEDTSEEKMQDDGDSFVARSPPLDPFRRSHGLEAPRNLLGEIARFSGLGIKNPAEEKRAIGVEQPQRMDGLKGIFTIANANEKDPNHPAIVTPRLNESSSSFFGQGDVIGVIDADDDGQPDDISSFTQSFDSESSRASWESRGSFNWSSNENGEPITPNRNRVSGAPSIPRPRADFTPRYPRNNSPTVLAQLASQHSLGMPPGASSNESSGHEDTSGFAASGSIANSDFSTGHNGLGRFGDSGFKSIDEEDEYTSGEGPAIVSMAERQSFETRQPTRPTPKLRPSKERIASPAESIERSPYSRQALISATEGEEGMYDDAEEYRRSMVGREEMGLGYPASAILGSEDGDEGQQKRQSTIIAIPQHDNPLSPPLPQVGSFIRPVHSPVTTSRVPAASANDGRVVACANETFSIHPQIHPPPTVSLSAATWSSAPPSTYRAEVEGGGQIPSWLHFDARELELWGVPSLNHSGECIVIRIIEKLPKDKRRSDPMAFGYEPQQEREVGRVAIEVVDRIKSPQFALENSPHAL